MARWISQVALPLALAAFGTPDALQAAVPGSSPKDVPVVRAHFLKLIERPHPKTGERGKRRVPRWLAILTIYAAIMAVGYDLCFGAG